MAKNQFGCICDICGYTNKYHNQFYRLTLPTFQSELGNGIVRLDYCFSCYENLKNLLKEYYKNN